MSTDAEAYQKFQDREHYTKQQKIQHDFDAAEEEKRRQFSISENEKEREHQNNMAEKQREWQANENAKDRTAYRKSEWHGGPG